MNQGKRERYPHVAPQIVDISARRRYNIDMDVLVFHEITFALFLLAYLPGILTLVQYVVLRLRTPWKRDKAKERICLAISFASLSTMAINIIAMIALAMA